MWLKRWRLYEPQQRNDHDQLLRVVIDVNVLVSGTIVPSGDSAFIVRSFKQGVFDIITSQQHLDELYRVLGRRRIRSQYHVTERRRKKIVGRLAQLAEFVQPSGALALCRDPTDDYLIEMAILGRATHLVTGDKDFHDDPALLRFLQEREVAVIYPADFVTFLREQTISGDIP
jgi:putative PIN family toxin of toxin-antitoxin system